MAKIYYQKSFCNTVKSNNPEGIIQSVVTCKTTHISNAEIEGGSHINSGSGGGSFGTTGSNIVFTASEGCDLGIADGLNCGGALASCPVGKITPCMWS